MEVRLLGAHNTESKNTRFGCVLIDDTIALDAGGLTSGLSLANQLKLKAVLLTHYHYDHVRDIPALAMAFIMANSNIEVYSTQTVRDTLATYLLDGKLYPNFLVRPSPENPTMKFTVLEPNVAVWVGEYIVLPVPVNHAVPAVGYQVTSPCGKSLFYTGDTGDGLSACWDKISPQLLLVEVTMSNRYTESARQAGHLTPGLLKEELNNFRSMKGYLPDVVAVHIDPRLEKEIKEEIRAVALELDASITVGREGMRISL